MLLHKTTKPRANDDRSSAPRNDRWLLADLEAAQRLDLYAAGRGDRRERPSVRRWTAGRLKRA